MSNIIELSTHIEYCPYCGSKDIVRETDIECNCNDCGMDFIVITHD